MIVLTDAERATLAATMRVLLDTAERDPWQVRRIPAGGAGLVRVLVRALAGDGRSTQERDTAPPEEANADAEVMQMLFSRAQVAHILGTREDSVQRLNETGELRSMKLRRQVRIHRDDIDDYLDRLRNADHDREGVAA